MPKVSSAGFKARLALLAGVMLAAAAGVVTSQTARARDEKPPVPLKLAIDAQPLQREANLQASFAPVVKGVAASVVSVSTETKASQREAIQDPFELNPWFRDFFGNPGTDRFRRLPRMPKQRGLGSGVIVTEDGYILTNNHVVDGADQITVSLNPDGRIYDAKVVGRDPKSDIAVLKIEATGLPVLPIGNSDSVEVGDVVLAIGNPFGVGQSVTMGIVGATGRAVFGEPMVGSSRVDLQACKLEYSIVSPK